jgi:hypothetical protein
MEEAVEAVGEAGTVAEAAIAAAINLVLSAMKETIMLLMDQWVRLMQLELQL